VCWEGREPKTEEKKKEDETGSFAEKRKTPGDQGRRWDKAWIEVFKKKRHWGSGNEEPREN